MVRYVLFFLLGAFSPCGPIPVPDSISYSGWFNAPQFQHVITEHFSL